jgi:peptidoglycan lytic transglycosylase B
MKLTSKRIAAALACTVLAVTGGAFAHVAEATPPLPMPPMPPENSVFLATPEPVLTSTGDAKVEAYRERLLTDYTSAGWRPYLVRLLAGVRANPKIVERFDRLASIREPKDYVRHYVTPERIRRGRQLYRQLKTTITKPADMPLELRIALWGMLADYGARLPQYDALQALLVLGAYERGIAASDFQLHHAARLVIGGVVPRERLRAYETGRISQAQLLPDRFDEWARDGNGDGRANVWTSRADILASIGAGDWSQYQGIPVYVAVRPARFNTSDPAEARMARTLEQPVNVPTGILRRWDGRPWKDSERSWSGTYVEPYGDKGPAFLMLFPAWPVNSRNPARPRYFDETNDMGFALAAGLLADAIAGRPLPSLP